jgi:hypothetical protein
MQLKASTRYYGKHDIEYILGNLDYVESQLAALKGNKIRNPRGLFMDALVKDYRTKGFCRINRTNAYVGRAARPGLKTGRIYPASA